MIRTFEIEDLQKGWYMLRDQNGEETFANQEMVVGHPMPVGTKLIAENGDPGLYPDGIKAFHVGSSECACGDDNCHIGKCVRPVMYVGKFGDEAFKCLCGHCWAYRKRIGRL
jgi:hypothetical protein